MLVVRITGAARLKSGATKGKFGGSDYGLARDGKKNKCRGGRASMLRLKGC